MTQNLSTAEQALRDAAREYHRSPVKGKISVTPTKPLSNQRDLSLAYSPGVAYPCLDIEADPAQAAEYTSRGNLVGVITNGTAVLGLGDIGPLAAKPVMEGKGCLFKKFAGVDVFDIELAERDPDKLIDIIASMEPTLGGINLEDIKAPECFYIEQEAVQAHEHSGVPRRPARHGHHLQRRPAQRPGTGGQGHRQGQGRRLRRRRGRHCLRERDGGPGREARERLHGRLQGRDLRRPPRWPGRLQGPYAQKTEARTLADVVNGADVFLGCSAPAC
jgi:malate dehydrogenase (oxaloacetate-decarboxylating)(NADP+)